MRHGREIVLEGFGMVPGELPRPVTSASLFGNDAPLELEIGSGKGTLLVTESKTRPGVNFLGVEYQRRYWRYASDRLRRHECDNAKLVLAEAATLLRDYLVDDSLAAVHIYFPDPWPKKRHHKRRLVQPGNVELIAKKMRPRAKLQIVTDHAEYFEQIENVIGRSSLEVVEFDAPAGADAQEMVGSNFERKYRREGRAFRAIAAVKK